MKLLSFFVSPLSFFFFVCTGLTWLTLNASGQDAQEQHAATTSTASQLSASALVCSALSNSGRRGAPLEFDAGTVARLGQIRTELQDEVPALCGQIRDILGRMNAQENHTEIGQIHACKERINEFLEHPKAILAPFVTMQNQSLHTYNEARELHEFFVRMQQGMHNADAAAEKLTSFPFLNGELANVAYAKNVAKLQQVLVRNEFALKRLLAAYQVEHPTGLGETPQEDQAFGDALHKRVTLGALAKAAVQLGVTAHVAPFAQNAPLDVEALDVLVGIHTSRQQQPQAVVQQPPPPQQPTPTPLERADTILTKAIVDTTQGHNPILVGADLAERRHENPTQRYAPIITRIASHLSGRFFDAMRLQNTDLFRNPVPLRMRIAYQTTRVCRTVAHAVRTAYVSSRTASARVYRHIEPVGTRGINVLAGALPHRTRPFFATCIAYLRGLGVRALHATRSGAQALASSQRVTQARAYFSTHLQGARQHPRTIALIDTVGTRLQRIPGASFVMNLGPRRWLQQANDTLADWAHATREYFNPPPDQHGREIREFMRQLGTPPQVVVVEQAHAVRHNDE